MNLMKILTIIVILLFVGSILVVFASGGRERNTAIIVVDLGEGQVYRGMPAMGENETAVKFLSRYVRNVQVEKGQVRCILDYCNTRLNEWKFYVMEETMIGMIEVEPDEPVDRYIVSPGETIVFRFERIPEEVPEEIINN